MTTSGERDVAVPGGHVHAWHTGSGPRLLVLHGCPGLSEYTDTLEPELGDGYRLIRFQQRGVPPSTREGPFEVERHMADAIAVLDAYEIAQACVVGHSWGGHLALHLGMRHPDRCSALVVLDPLGAVGDGGEADLGRILTERLSPEVAARVSELDEQAMAAKGGEETALELLRLVWPGYFASPQTAPPMPPVHGEATAALIPPGRGARSSPIAAISRGWSAPERSAGRSTPSMRVEPDGEHAAGADVMVRPGCPASATLMAPAPCRPRARGASRPGRVTPAPVR